MHFRVTILALALVSGSAFAQSTLTQGKSLVSDGLYEQKSEDGTSFVAVNAAGHRALHDRLVADQALLEKSYAADGINATERASLDQMNTAISKLAPAFASTKASQSNQGLCGTTPVYTSATSTGGISASSYAAASDTGPAVDTTNYAFATMGVTYSQAATSGSTPAIASGTNPRVCVSVGFSTVTCPTATTPAASAYAISFRRSGAPCQVQ